MRITKTRIATICLLAVIIAVLFSVWLLMRTPPEFIADRKSARAVISIPGVLRDFPVGKHAGSADSFIYRRLSAGEGWRYWRLEINAAAQDADYWKNAFDSYLAKRAKSIQRPGGQMHMILFRSDKNGMDQGWVTFLSTEPTGKLDITFGYRELVFAQRMLRTRAGRLLALVLRKIGLPIDTVTWPS